MRHFIELRRYLLLSMISAVGGLFFIIYPVTSFRMLCYFIAAYALFLGIGKFRLAQHWDSGRCEKIVINILGAIAVCFSGVLVAIANQEDREVIVVLAAYSVFVGGQMLLTTFYLYRQRMTRAGSASAQEQVHA